jgi:hypothetical protein
MNSLITPPPSFFKQGGNRVLTIVSYLKVHKISAFLIVFFTVALMNYGNVFSQQPESCDPEESCMNAQWATDTMTVEIPGYSGCYAFVTYRIKVCDNGLVQFEITSMNLMTAACYVFNSLLFPFGSMNPPNEIFLRQNWNNILEVVMKKDFERISSGFPLWLKEQYYCDGNERMFQYSTIKSYCQRYCLGVYTYTGLAFPTGPTQFYSVQYKDCDNESCCINLVEFCINRATGEVVKYSETTTQTGGNCSTIPNPPNCIFLTLPDYSFEGHAGDCTNTCIQE